MEKQKEHSVKCCLCSHEKEDACSLKKAKVHKNKRRNCALFLFDKAKVKPVNTILTTRGIINKALARKERYRLKKLAKEALMVQAPVYAPTDHPLTGDLSRFISTGAEEVTPEVIN